jgi:hypothetical protein
VVQALRELTSISHRSRAAACVYGRWSERCPGLVPVTGFRQQRASREASTEGMSGNLREELDGWWRDTLAWQKELSFCLFTRWFGCHYRSTVFDLRKAALKRKDVENLQAGVDENEDAEAPRFKQVQ